jgi:hypothetical protein
MKRLYQIRETLAEGGLERTPVEVLELVQDFCLEMEERKGSEFTIDMLAWLSEFMLDPDKRHGAAKFIREVATEDMGLTDVEVMKFLVLPFAVEWEIEHGQE